MRLSARDFPLFDSHFRVLMFCLWQNTFQKKGVFKAEKAVENLTPGFKLSPGKNEADCLVYSAGLRPPSPPKIHRNRKTKQNSFSLVEAKKKGPGGGGRKIVRMYSIKIRFKAVFILFLDTLFLKPSVCMSRFKVVLKRP